MSGYIKSFENGSKNLSSCIKNDEVWDKCDTFWDLIKNKLNIKFHRKPVYKYLKAKVREFNGVIKTNFLNNSMLKENLHYYCIACVTIDSDINLNKKNHPQVYLEECKCRIKKTQMPKFLNNELKSNSESHSDLHSDNKELMTKLNKSDIDFDYDSDSEAEPKSNVKLMAKLKKFDSDKN